MKKGWEIKKLGEVCEMYQPKTISTKEMIDGPYSVFGANGIIGKHNVYNHEEIQLLITCRGATCGAINLSEPKSWINGNAMVIRPKDRSIELKFLEYLFRGGIDLSKTITGAAQPQITRQSLNPLKIFYPKSLSEQQRIISILDEVFATIDRAKANAEQNLKNARELFESYLQGVFEKRGEGWIVKTLGEVCTLITDGKHGDCENESNSGYYFLSAKDVRDETLLFENSRQITKAGFEETHRRTNLMPGDICMVNTGATIGRISLAPDDPRTYRTTFQKSVAVIKTIPTLINNQYCCYLLKSDLKKLVNVSSGTAVPNLLLGDLKRHKINLPKSLSEQQSIVSRLDALSGETKRLESIYQQKLQGLEEMRKSVLEKAFKGELKTIKEVEYEL